MKIESATIEDVSQIVEMLADDPLGAKREEYADPLPKVYHEAFERILEDPNQELVVVKKGQEVIGTMQVSFITYLTYRGGTRAQIEGVRIRKDYRGAGVGKMLILWAIDQSRQRNAHVVQLTTDKKRPEALSFYENLGFVSSHVGMKLHL